MNGCPHRDEAGAWVLHALAQDDAARFEEHLRSCTACRSDVAQLQTVADALPMAAPQAVPPPELKRRIMSVVESEADVLRAAGPAADRPAPRRERPRWWRALGLRPLPAVAMATAILAVGIAGGVLLSGTGAGAKSYSAQAPRGARVVLKVDGDRGRLDVRGMPAPPAGRVYQVWLARGSGPPQPTHTLWVPREGRATVEIAEPLDGTEKVLVTAEPMGGSDTPTSAPVVQATLI